MKKTTLVFTLFFLLQLQPFAQQGRLIYSVTIDKEHASSVFKSLKKASAENKGSMYSDDFLMPMTTAECKPFLSGTTVAPDKYFVYLNWDATSDIFYILGITPRVPYLGLNDSEFKIKAPYYRISDFEPMLAEPDLKYMQSVIKNGFYQYVNSKTSTVYNTVFADYLSHFSEEPLEETRDTNATTYSFLATSPALKVKVPVTVSSIPVNKHFLTQFPVSWLKSAMIDASMVASISIYQDPTLTYPITYREANLPGYKDLIPNDSLYLSETWEYKNRKYGFHGDTTIVGSFLKKYYSLGMLNKDKNVVWTIFDEVGPIRFGYLVDNKRYWHMCQQFFTSEFIDQLGVKIIEP
jgi:hypothetical protein